ncbi:MAG: AtpZ/AtpI family protein [Alphaproteobacteria bacterium]|jgi:ATP synthase protein I|nr:AtpZ/AtpI family protein [Alphaproteobacteria bacterium]MDP6517510.1 AtpZ/AtpI family protein [Alphaproteobacteria bacterium]
MSGDQPPPSLDDLDSRIKQVRDQQTWSETGPVAPGGLAWALRLTTEMVAALIVGGGIGWMLDKSLGTRPWLLLVFLVIGMAAGMLNIYRTAQRITRAAGAADKAEDDNSRST